jgi:hypothetical protein
MGSSGVSGIKTDIPGLARHSPELLAPDLSGLLFVNILGQQHGILRMPQLCFQSFRLFVDVPGQLLRDLLPVNDFSGIGQKGI